MLKVIAIGINPRIYDVERDRIQEFLDGTHPMSSKRKTYDSGTKKKTVLDQSPVGPPEIPEEPGDKSSHDNVGSGYNKGPDPGGQADDETGPGNTPSTDKEQTFTDHSTSEIASRSNNDFSSKWSPLNFDSNKRDQKITQHLMRLHNGNPISKSRRYHVDRQSNTRWKGIFVYNEIVN